MESDLLSVISAWKFELDVKEREKMERFKEQGMTMRH